MARELCAKNNLARDTVNLGPPWSKVSLTQLLVDKEIEYSLCKQISMQLILNSNPQNEETINYI